ncbi:MAG TPA: hypothetical protein VK983_05515 [Candidatus Limnocylindrales bacterium]|nr:hypothetical protein [Candidatus Limnocylindrales bacterium]
MGIENFSDYRDDKGRWDIAAEMQDIRIRSLIEAAVACGISKEMIQALAMSFETNFITNMRKAEERPTGEDGFPITK